MKIVTHNATFHTDDVFAVATLFLVYGKENCMVIRTRDVNEIATGDIVVDVGEVYDPLQKRFDHHQKDASLVRENGIPYASFGLVWKSYGEKLSDSKETADTIDRVLVMSIDAGDNGVSTFTPIYENVAPALLSDAVMLHRPTLSEEKNFDERFLEAVDQAMWIIGRWIKTINDNRVAEQKVKDIYKGTEDKRIIILNEEDSFGRELVVRIASEFPEPLYVIHYRKDHESWQIVGTRKEPGSFEIRKPFPASWLGKSGAELSQATGVEGSIFCHKGNFICNVETKEGAIKLAEIAVNA
jgi:uncharacterized UPF0160 family protein